MEDPIYEEAYPRLDIFQAKLSNRANSTDFNRRSCRFRIGETGCAGELVILARTDSTVVIDYWLRGAEHRYWSDLISLSLVDAPNGVDPDRQLFLCEDCQKGRAVLVFCRGAWLCRSCHGLCHRSQLIGPQVRMQEELAEIDDLIPGGTRPKHMQGGKFHLLKQRRADIFLKLELECEASEAHRQVIRAEWSEVANVPYMLHPGYEKEGDVFVAKPPPPPPEIQPVATPVPAARQLPNISRFGEVNDALVGKSYWFDE